MPLFFIINFTHLLAPHFHLKLSEIDSTQEVCMLSGQYVTVTTRHLREPPGVGDRVCVLGKKEMAQYPFL